jgi:hypothetical protein
VNLNGIHQEEAMSDLDQLNTIANKKRLECAVDAKAYSMWLSALIPANIVLVVGAALLSLVAGASILVEQDIIEPTTAGVLAIVSAAFTIIHNKLNCDQHQAECRRLKSLYEGLSEDYGNLEMISEFKDCESRLDALNTERSQIKKGAGASPPPKYVERARKFETQNA